MAEPPNTDAKDLKSWLDDIAAYERAYKSWESRVDKILKRYRDETRTGARTWTESKFNILWSNVQTLTSATFAKLPKPDVFRSFRDQDPVARVAALLLERSLEYHLNHYKQYRTALKANVLDRFLGGRGTAWVRYEPHFRAAQGADGAQITEDIDTPDEELDYECVSIDYVHYKDFGHSVARSWDEVRRVWRKVYMTKDGMVERFGEEVAKAIPMDADGAAEMRKRDYVNDDAIERATIYEGWDKETREAVWFSKAAKKFLDRREDPLGLEDVFPCPKPLYATLTNDSLVPVPDFVIYQDQANDLDLLSDKIDGLVKALKVCGGYDASIPELQRIFTEGENGSLIPIKNWAAFAEKNGLQGAISLVDLKPTADALISAYQAFHEIKGSIDELTGISDVMRGETNAAETATAQQLKSNYGNLRLKDYQDQVSSYASDLLKLMAQVICGKFSPDTIRMTGGADQLSEMDRQYVDPALELLIGRERMTDPNAPPATNPVRNFRIEVSTDSMVFLDEQQEKQSRTEFLGAVAAYLKGVSEALVAMPREVLAVMVPLLMDMLKFGVTGYRVGKTIEGAFESAAEQLKQLAQQPPPPQAPPPEVQVEQMKQQTEQQRMQMQMRTEREKMAAQNQLEREKMVDEQKFEREKMAAEFSLKEREMQDQMALDDTKHKRTMELDDTKHQREVSLKREAGQEKIGEEVGKSFGKYEDAIKELLDKAKQSAEVSEAKESAVQQMGDEVRSQLGELGEAIKMLIEQLGKPRRLIRGPDGRAAGSETLQ